MCRRGCSTRLQPSDGPSGGVGHALCPCCYRVKSLGVSPGPHLPLKQFPFAIKTFFTQKSSLLARPLFSLYFRSSHREFPCCGTICSRSRLRQGPRPPGFNRASDKSGWLELAGLTGDYISPRFPTTSKLEKQTKRNLRKELVEGEI